MAYAWKLKSDGKYNDWNPIPDEEYYSKELYGQGMTSDDVDNYVETKNNDTLGWVKDAFDAGASNVLAGQFDWLNEKAGVGANAADYFHKVAKDNQRTENPEFGSVDYFTNPQGALYDLGNQGGSSVAMMLEAAAAATAIGSLVPASIAGALGTFGTSAVAGTGVLGAASKAMPLLRNPVARGLAGAYTASSAPEAVSESGNWMKEQRDAGKLTDEQIQSGGNDVLLNNLGLLTTTNALEAASALALQPSLAGRLSAASGIKGTLGALIKNAATIGAVEGVQNGYEEGAQAAIGDVASGENKKGFVNPSNWSDENWQEAKVGAFGGAVFGAVAGAGSGLVKVSSAKKADDSSEEERTASVVGQNKDILVSQYLSIDGLKPEGVTDEAVLTSLKENGDVSSYMDAHPDEVGSLVQEAKNEIQQGLAAKEQINLEQTEAQPESSNSTSSIDRNDVKFNATPEQANFIGEVLTNVKSGKYTVDDAVNLLNNTKGLPSTVLSSVSQYIQDNYGNGKLSVPVENGDSHNSSNLASFNPTQTAQLKLLNDNVLNGSISLDQATNHINGSKVFNQNPDVLASAIQGVKLADEQRLRSSGENKFSRNKSIEKIREDKESAKAKGLDDAYKAIISNKANMKTTLNLFKKRAKEDSIYIEKAKAVAWSRLEAKSKGVSFDEGELAGRISYEDVKELSERVNSHFKFNGVMGPLRRAYASNKITLDNMKDRLVSKGVSDKVATTLSGLERFARAIGEGEVTRKEATEAMVAKGWSENRINHVLEAADSYKTNSILENESTEERAWNDTRKESKKITVSHPEEIIAKQVTTGSNVVSAIGDSKAVNESNVNSENRTPSAKGKSSVGKVDKVNVNSNSNIVSENKINFNIKKNGVTKSGKFTFIKKTFSDIKAKLKILNSVDFGHNGSRKVDNTYTGERRLSPNNISSDFFNKGILPNIERAGFYVDTVSEFSTASISDVGKDRIVNLRAPKKTDFIPINGKRDSRGLIKATATTVGPYERTEKYNVYNLTNANSTALEESISPNKSDLREFKAGRISKEELIRRYWSKLSSLVLNPTKESHAIVDKILNTNNIVFADNFGSGFNVRSIAANFFTEIAKYKENYSPSANFSSYKVDVNGTEVGVKVADDIKIKDGTYRKDITSSTKYTDVLSKVLGVPVRFITFDNQNVSDSINGFFGKLKSDKDAPPSIHVNLNSSHSSGWIFGHEFAHNVIANKNSDFLDLFNALKSSLKINNAFNKVIDQYRDVFALDENFSDDDVFEEFFCDLVGDRVADGSFIGYVYDGLNEDNSKTAKMLVSIRNYLKVVNEKIGDSKLNRSESQIAYNALNSLNLNISLSIDRVLSNIINSSLVNSSDRKTLKDKLDIKNQDMIDAERSVNRAENDIKNAKDNGAYASARGRLARALEFYHECHDKFYANLNDQMSELGSNKENERDVDSSGFISPDLYSRYLNDLKDKNGGITSERIASLVREVNTAIQKSGNYANKLGKLFVRATSALMDFDNSHLDSYYSHSSSSKRDEMSKTVEKYKTALYEHDSAIDKQMELVINLLPDVRDSMQNMLSKNISIADINSAAFEALMEKCGVVPLTASDYVSLTSETSQTNYARFLYNQNNKSNSISEIKFNKYFLSDVKRIASNILLAQKDNVGKALSTDDVRQFRQGFEHAEDGDSGYFRNIGMEKIAEVIERDAGSFYSNVYSFARMFGQAKLEGILKNKNWELEKVDAQRSYWQAVENQYLKEFLSKSQSSFELQENESAVADSSDSSSYDVNADNERKDSEFLLKSGVTETNRNNLDDSELANGVYNFFADGKKYKAFNAMAMFTDAFNGYSDALIHSNTHLGQLFDKAQAVVKRVGDIVTRAGKPFDSSFLRIEDINSYPDSVRNLILTRTGTSSVEKLKELIRDTKQELRDDEYLSVVRDEVVGKKRFNNKFSVNQKGQTIDPDLRAEFTNTSSFDRIADEINAAIGWTQQIEENRQAAIKSEKNSGILDVWAWSPSRLAKKFPRFAPVFNMADRANKLENKYKDKLMTSFDKTYHSLDEDVRHDVDSCFIYADGLGKELTTEDYSFIDVSEEGIKAYEKTRKLLDKTRKLINIVNSSLGLPEIGYVSGYFPHHWDGFSVEAVINDAKNVYNFKSFDDAKDKMDEIVKGGGKAQIVVTTTGFYKPEQLEGGTSLLGKDMYLDSSQSFTLDSKDFENLGDDFFGTNVKVEPYKRFLAQAIARKGSLGYSLDVGHVLAHYINSSARYAAIAPFKHKAVNYFVNTFGKRDNYGHLVPNSFNLDYSDSSIANYTKKYILDMNGNPQMIEKLIDNAISNVPFLRDFIRKHSSYGDRYSVAIANTTTEAVAVSTLGLYNVASGFMQLSQILNAHVLLGEKIAFSAMKRLASNNLTENDKYALEHSFIKYDANIANEGRAKGGKFSYGKIMNLLGKSMYLFQKGDMFSRKVAICGAFDKAIREGMSKADALKYAIDINRRCNFDNSVVDSSGLFRSASVLGQIALQFKKYSLKQCEFALDACFHADKATRTRYLVSFCMLAGILGIPFSGIFDKIGEMLLGKSPMEQVKKLALSNSKNGELNPLLKVILYGAPSLAGVDLSRRASQDFGGIMDFSSIPALNKIQNFAKGVNEGGILSPKALMAISPSLGAVATALQGHPNGLKMQYTGTQKLLRAGGFIPIQEAIERDQQMISQHEGKKNDGSKLDEKGGVRFSSTAKSTVSGISGALLTAVNLSGISHVVFETFGYGKKTVKIVKVIDGDTFVTSDGETIRALGIDTPEIYKDFVVNGKRVYNAGQPYGEEAKEYAKKELLNKDVTLTRDFGDKDKYNRSLRYIQYDKGLYQANVLNNGLAKLLIIKENRRKEGELTRLDEARKKKFMKIGNE